MNTHMYGETFFNTRAHIIFFYIKSYDRCQNCRTTKLAGDSITYRNTYIYTFVFILFVVCIGAKRAS